MSNREETRLDAATLEKLRRGLPLSMDGLGRFFFEGDEVSHPRVVRFLRRALDATEAGEFVVRIDEQWAYLTVADLPLRVLRVVAEDAGPTLVLDDGRAVLLDPTTLWEEPDRGLRCRVPSVSTGRPLPARFTNPAQMDLDRWIEWDEGDERPWLCLGTDRRSIPEVAPTSAGE